MNSLVRLSGIVQSTKTEEAMNRAGGPVSCTIVNLHWHLTFSHIKKKGTKAVKSIDAAMSVRKV